MVHLDIHAKNILLTSFTGDCLVACLADFGIAHLFHDTQVLPGFEVHPELHRAAELFFAKGAKLQDTRRRVHFEGVHPIGGADPKYTLDYMQPRNIPRHCFAPALDIWAYGCLMYYIKCHKHLFDDANSYNECFRASPRAQLVLDIVSALGEPASALITKHSWNRCGSPVLQFRRQT